ncbi:MAG: hypothetical protein QGH38_02910 [Candidatus Thalassarchaeaceae archaeon]|nr:hypothetical protein [Candidatus Thalassarchaeaceae archaeon]
MMGLLEKADQIKSDAPSPEPAPATNEVTPEPVPVSPAPVEPKPEKKPRGRRSKRQKTPRKKRVRAAKVLPEGYEEASTGQKFIRRASDFAVSWGWCVPLVLLNAWGSYFDPTYFVLIGLGLMGFNLVFMPRTTNRTVGNWISRTTYITSGSKQPHQSYLLFKGLTFAVTLVGILMVATSLQDLDKSSGQILLGVGAVILLPPLLDYLFYRFKRDNLGLWDTLYGGVWLVRTTKTAEAKGWLKRLEQLGDYSEERGWWKDSEGTESAEPTE